jgi:tetratricopeptide (TPR) repeat protein
VRWLAFLLTFQQALWIDVPFIRQDKNGCGSAVIWMVMKYWQPELEIDVDEIQRQLYSKEAGGIYAKDLTRYLESRGYRALAFRGDWADLEEQVSKGRPLIVCLERNSRGVPLHYVVVAGIDPIDNLVLVNDPAQRKLLSMSRSEFERSWQATDNWTLLAMPELDLASKAFREENLTEAREHLDSALRANPSDVHTNDFLGTVYFLQDNTEAALKYWNRAGKPSIENIRIDPPLHTDPVLLDRAFAFSRGSVLSLRDFEETQARLNALQVFSRYRLELSAKDGDRFDVTLRAAERSGANFWSWAQGLPFQSVQPGVSNIRGKAVDIGSKLRWDPNKRRVFAFVQAPLNGDPKWGFRTSIDARDENWLSTTGGFRMRKIEAAGEIRGIHGGRWNWTSGASVSSRQFSNSLAGGVELKYSGSVTRAILREPSRHLTLDSSINIESGKLFGVSPLRFTKLVSDTNLHWLSFTSRMRMGGTFGSIPFDENFVLGLDRDSDLWLRAHSATVEGRKNASSTSRAFAVTNLDYQRTLLDTAWYRISAGPFLDAGKSSSATQWLVDSGIEVRFSILNSFGINISYGRSLSDTSHSLFVRPNGF